MRQPSALRRVPLLLSLLAALLAPAHAAQPPLPDTAPDAAPAPNTVPATGQADAAQAAPSPDPASPSAAEQAAQLFATDWAWQLRHQPERATGLGEARFNGELSDTTLAARAFALAHHRSMLDGARQIARDQLAPAGQLDLDAFIALHQHQVALGELTPFDPLPISSHDGLHVRLPRLVAQMPFQSQQDYEAYLARLAALPAHVDGIIEQLRAGLAAGWSVPQAVLAPVPEQLRLLREQRHDGPLAAPFARIPAVLDEPVREELRARGARALDEQLAPALQRLEQYLRQEYLAAARTTIGASAQPGGGAWYALLVREATGSELSPAQIHAIGLQEVARLRRAGERLVPRTGFRGSLAQFLVFARSDARLMFRDGDALLARYRRTLAIAQARIGRVVTDIPEAGIVVKPMQGASGQPAAYYEPGHAERSAALVVDTAHAAMRPVWQADTIALHEGVPGHHLQLARMQALALPAFRRHGWHPAFGEGWATYAESLGPTLGLLTDPFSEFGHLNEELFRAARLVVDTGIHALGWSRQQAIDYLNTHTANPVADNAAEVDRYIARPAQALSYKMGQLTIEALRLQAKAALGQRFELRRFHDALLAHGTLPLPLLRQQMARWVRQQQANDEPQMTYPSRAQ